jgi:hypothetical protein
MMKEGSEDSVEVEGGQEDSKEDDGIGERERERDREIESHNRSSSEQKVSFLKIYVYVNDFYLKFFSL